MRRVFAGLVGVVLMTTGIAPAAAARAPVVPGTPVGRQVTWLIGATHHLPISEPDAVQHLDPGPTAAVGLDQINASLAETAGTGGLVLVSYAGTADAATVGMTGAGRTLWLMDIEVDSSGLIAGVRFRRPVPTSWREIHDRLRALGPDVSFLAARLRDGACRAVDTLSGSTARPLGSAFKLYVLGALADAVKKGTPRGTSRSRSGTIGRASLPGSSRPSRPEPNCRSAPTRTR